MITKSDLTEVISSIQADVATIVKGELELAKAELMPQAKAAGKGAGLFGAAGYLALSGAALLFSGLAFWLSLGFQTWFQLDLLPALTLGFTSVALIFFLCAGVLVLIGRTQLKFTPPAATVANAEQTVESIKGALEQGKADVAAMSLTGRRADLETSAVLPRPSGSSGTAG